MNHIDNLLHSIADIKINVNEEMILERLHDKFRWPIRYSWNQPSLEIIDKTTARMKAFNSYYAGDVIDVNKVLEYYNNGYTILLSNIGTLFNDFNILQNILNNYFNKNININLYVGKGKEVVSFHSHKHEYDVIVKNVYGKSDWIIDNTTKTLSDQNVLYLPKHSMHEVVKIYGSKCSLTCNIV